MSQTRDLIDRLRSCPAGTAGWAASEDACIAALSYLFVPPLQPPVIQPRTYSGTSRRDAVFSNRERDPNTKWGLLHHDLAAHLILFEFKNYQRTGLGQDEVNQAANYLTAPMGRLAIIVCRHAPNRAAHLRRNTVFSNDKKVILFVTSTELIEMLNRKEAGQDPADLILDLWEAFLLQHE